MIYVGIALAAVGILIILVGSIIVSVQKKRALAALKGTE